MKKSNLIKRILAYTLVLSVVFSQMIFSHTATAASAANNNVWDGTKAESFAGGDGTAASPFLIETAEQLYKMVVEYDSFDASKDKYFLITKDIYLNAVNADTKVISLWGKNNWLADYGKEINAAGRSNTFSGTLDGDGHTIYGLYANGADKNGSCLGLFPAISDHASIKNLNFNKLFLTGGSGSAGAIAGHAYWKVNGKVATITNCSVVDAIIGQLGNIESIGGFVGNTNDCTITFSNCYTNDVELSLYNEIIPGGITGNAWSGGTVRINNCYSAGYFPVRANISKAVCTNVYTDAAIPEGNTTANVTVLTSEQMKGEAAKTNMAGFDFEYTWQTTENGYPILTYIKFWDGTKAKNYAGGSGTENDPYLVENGAQLFKMVSENTAVTSDAVFTTPKYFKITKDIYLNKVTSSDMLEPTVDAWNEKGFEDWLPGYNYKQSTGFCGNIDGDGNTIYGLYNSAGTYAGFLPNVVDSATVTNLNFKNAFVRASGNGGPGGIIGIVNGASNNRSTATVSYCSMDNCYIFADATGSWRCGAIVGGGAGEGKITVTNCVVTNIKMKVTNTGTPNRTCAFIGNTNTYKGHEVTNCFTDDSAHPVTDSTTSDMYNVIHDNKVYKNVYTSAAKPDCDTKGDITYLTADQMKGEAAKENMSSLDFNFIWQTVENDYPILRKNIFYDWWNGTKAENFAGGDGTEASPFLIENAEQLYKMVEEYYTHTASLGKYFKITKDIYISNPGTNKTFSGAKNWLAAYGDTIATASKENSFSGTLDGGLNTIYGLYVSGKKSEGLFPSISSYADIKNIAFDNAYVAGGSGNAGALAGSAYWYDDYKTATISNCSVINSTIGKSGNIAYGGGLVGHMLDCTITFTNCYAYGNSLSDWGTPGGIVGNAYETSGKLYLVNCYSAGQYPVRATVNKAVCTNVYTDTARPTNNTTENITVLDSAKMTGKTAIDNLVGFNFNQIWQYGAEDEYPTHKSTEDKAIVWDGTMAANYAGGDGSIETPYEIATAEQLYKLANASTEDTFDKYYKLTSDIAISSLHDGWEKERPYTWAKKTAYLDGFTYGNSFAGTLDGAGYTVSGLYYDDEITDNGTYAYGLIPFVSANAVIKNINVEGVCANVEGDAYIGAVAGAAHVKSEDISNPLNMVQIVGVNVANSGDIAILGGASRGVKFELCNADKLIGMESENISVRNCNNNAKYDDSVVIYNIKNADAVALTNIRKSFMGTFDAYITDINGDSAFDLKDLVSMKKCLTMAEPEETLVWSQEFNGDALNYSVLEKKTDLMSKGSTLEYADNAIVNDGNLKLYCTDTGKKDTNDDTIYSVNYGLSTVDTMSFKYGRLEMRAKIPFVAGAFPSLWLTSRGAIGYDSSCAYSTEIDIFEVFGNGAFDYGELTSNNHQMAACIHKWYNDENGKKIKDENGKVIDCSCGTSDKGNEYIKDESDRSKTFYSQAERDAFHKIVFEWTEDKMTFIVDEVPFYTVTKEEIEDKFGLEGMSKDATGIFEQFLCINLNNHMYTTGAGAAYTYKGAASEIDASKINYEIDYIRLYQKNDGKSVINLK